MIVISLIVTVAITLTVTATATVRVTVTVKGTGTVTAVTIGVILTIPDGKEVYTMHCDCVLSTNRIELPLQQPCIHEDTRLAVHALDISLSGHKQIKIRSNDTDVVLLAISAVNIFLADELWIAYDTGKRLYNPRGRTDSTSLSQDQSVLPMDVPRHNRMQTRVSVGSLEDTKSQSTGSVTQRYH